MWASKHIAVGYYSSYHLFYGQWEVGVMDDYGNLVLVACIPREVFYYVEQ